MSAPQAPAVEFRRVTHSYGSHTAVDDVSLRIEEGEFFALLGPSGSGKTTLLMLIAGFERPQHGEVILRGQSVSSVPVHLRNIGVVFQDYALFPHLTVAENIEFPLRSRRVPSRERAERVAWAMNLMQLDGRGGRRPGELSGGQRQRVALARAIVFGPSLLLMDEPLGALDRAMREDMKVELKRIQQELGVTVVYVTHDQSEAMAMADRVGVMNDSILQQVAPPETLYARPCNEFIAQFVGDASLLRATVSGPEQSVLCGSLVPHQRTSLEDDVVLALRPASVNVVPEDDRDATLGATLDSKIYLGAGWRVHAHLTDGQRIAGTAAPSPFLSGLRVGDAIGLAWSTDAATPLATESALS